MASSSSAGGSSGWGAAYAVKSLRMQRKRHKDLKGVYYFFGAYGQFSPDLRCPGACHVTLMYVRLEKKCGQLSAVFVTKDGDEISGGCALKTPRVGDIRHSQGRWTFYPSYLHPTVSIDIDNLVTDAIGSVDGSEQTLFDSSIFSRDRVRMFMENGLPGYHKRCKTARSKEHYPVRLLAVKYSRKDASAVVAQAGVDTPGYVWDAVNRCYEMAKGRGSYLHMTVDKAASDASFRAAGVVV